MNSIIFCIERRNIKFNQVSHNVIKHEKASSLVDLFLPIVYQIKNRR